MDDTILIAGSVLKKRIPLLFQILFAVGGLFFFRSGALGTEIVAEVSLFLVPDPLRLRLLALMISLLVIELAVVTAAKLGIAVRTHVLPLDFLLGFYGLPTLPT
jgi:hypothetical protein